MALLVGSVFADHPRSVDWYNLQLYHLEKTTRSFNHLVCSSGPNIFKRSIFKSIDKLHEKHEHVLGLNVIVKYFRDHKEFDTLLVLDSDCFPIQHWQDNLVTSMRDFEVAAVVRCENLDTFAHPCVVFANRNAGEQLRFMVDRKRNILGKEYDDTASNISSFFPLIRSNRLNYHPILFGIYWEHFYHHGAGSRGLNFRIFFQGYYKSLGNISRLEAKKFEELKAAPNKFINSMTYSKVIKIL